MSSGNYVLKEKVAIPLTALGKFVLCEKCKFSGKRTDLEWIPFNPIDTFLGKDSRDSPNNIIKFREICPNCKTEDSVVVV